MQVLINGNPELNSTIVYTIVWAVFFGLLSQVAAYRLRIPAIVLLLICGVLLGPSMSNIIKPESLGNGLTVLVKLAVALILFEGSLNLRISALRHSLAEVRNLVTTGAVIAWTGTALATRYIAQMEWPLAALFGALMTVTGPTVVQPLLKRINVSRRIKTILEGEAILIDPVGAILAVAVLDVILGLSAHRPVGILFVAWSYFGRLIIGVTVGGGIALLLSRLLKIPHLIPSELENLVVLAWVWGSFGIAEKLHSEAGIMASVAMGLMLQREAVPGERQLRHFKETLTVFSISVLFILLAANLRLDAVWNEGLRGLLTVISIMFVVRPAAVFIAARHSYLNWREKLFIAWIGPRGIVAASVASLFGVTLREAGIAHGDRLLALTFLTIILTVTIQGLTASAAAGILKLQRMKGRRVVIVGANRFGRKLAEIIHAHARPVALVDSNQSLVKEARQAGLMAITGNALDEYILEKAGIDEAETLIAITSNSEVNILTAQFAHEVFKVKRTFLVLNAAEQDSYIKTLKHTGGRIGFGRPVDILAWENSNMYAMTWSIPAAWSKTHMKLVQLPNDLLPVIRLRDNSAEIVHAEQEWRQGDSIIFMACIPDAQAKEYLGKVLPCNAA